MWLNARIGVCKGSQCDLCLGGGIELMVLGFISLLLTVFQPVVASLCMSERLNKSMLPCAYDTNANETSTCAAVEILSLMLCGCVCVCFLLVLNLIHVSFPGFHILRMLLIGKRTQSAGGGPNHLSGELTSDTPVHICARNSPCVLQLHHCPSWFPEGED